MMFMKMIKKIVLSAVRPLARAVGLFSVASLIASWIQPARNSMSNTAKNTEVAVRYAISCKVGSGCERRRGGGGGGSWISGSELCVAP